MYRQKQDYSKFCACSRSCSINNFNSMAACVSSIEPALEPKVLASLFISRNKKSKRFPKLLCLVFLEVCFVATSLMCSLWGAPSRWKSSFTRSEERRVGKECRSPWGADRENKNKNRSGSRQYSIVSGQMSRSWCATGREA